MYAYNSVSFCEAVNFSDKLFVACLLYCVENIGDCAFILYDVILQGAVAGLQLSFLDQQSFLVFAASINLFLELFQLNLYLDIGCFISMRLTSFQFLDSLLQRRNFFFKT